MKVVAISFWSFIILSFSSRIMSLLQILPLFDKKKGLNCRPKVTRFRSSYTSLIEIVFYRQLFYFCYIVSLLSVFFPIFIRSTLKKFVIQHPLFIYSISEFLIHAGLGAAFLFLHRSMCIYCFCDCKFKVIICNINIIV